MKFLGLFLHYIQLIYKSLLVQHWKNFSSFIEILGCSGLFGNGGLLPTKIRYLSAFSKVVKLYFHIKAVLLHVDNFLGAY